MAWREDAEQGLPPQRHQEPLALRQDILDELADHLSLAAEREVDAGAQDETVIRNRVLNQFGNPSTIAYSLWWGAMKETVMKDWIQISVNAILCLSIMVFMALFYRQIQGNNVALLNALNANNTAVQTQNPSVEFIFHRGTIDGPVAKNIKTSLSGKIFSEDTDSIVEYSDAEGQVSIGPIRAGRYALTYSDEVTGLNSIQNVVLYSNTGTKTVHVTVPPTTRIPLDTSALFSKGMFSEDIRVQFDVETQWVYETTLWTNVDRSVRRRPASDPVPGTFQVIANAGGLNKATSSQGSKAFDIGEAMTYIYGNRVRFRSLKLLELDTSMDNSSTLYPRRVTEVGFSAQFELNDAQKIPITLEMPEEAQKMYSLMIRQSANAQHGLPERFAWFPEYITETYTDYVIDEAKLVEKSSLRMNDNGYWIYGGSQKILNVQKNIGLLYSLKNIPKPIPEGYKLLLVMPKERLTLKELKANLGVYWDYTSEEAKEHLDDKDEWPAVNDEEPIWSVKAEAIDQLWPRFMHIDLTDALQEKWPSNATGIVFQWEEESCLNSLGLFAPEESRDNNQPVWVLLKPIEDAPKIASNTQ